MKRIIFCLLLSIIATQQIFAQTKKIYCYIETESNYVFKYNTFEWKAEVPYKHFVRLVSEVIEVHNEYYIREQFYEYVIKNYLPDFKKMKLHKDFVRISIFNYDNPHQPEDGYSYKQLFKEQAGSSWQYEAILIKGFKYNPNNKGPWPLLEKAKKLLVEGNE